MSFKYDEQPKLENTGCRISDCGDHFCYHFRLNNHDSIFEIGDEDVSLTFKITTDYFEKYGQIKPIISATNHSLCSNSQSKLVEIIKADFSIPMNRLLIESNFLYLIYKLDSTYQKSLPDCESCAFLNKPNEIDKITQAKNYILQHLDESITIPKIATEVGTNQCYLKKGFKEIFDVTIFEFVQEQRMLKAHHLLLQTNDSISTIATKIGYASISSFSTAFKNYFGFSPKEIKQTIS